jgi:Zn-dependent protease with chaperone function
MFVQGEGIRLGKPMDDEQFRALVRRLEAEERARPALYRARVVLLAALGYAYIGVVLLVLLALLAATVAIMASGHAGVLFKAVIALLVAAWFILRALWVRFHPPEGRRLSREEAPVLFAEAEEIARKLDAPRADVVLLNTDFNASVSQIPRLGIFGFPRNYLSIGMPLLAALPHSHVRAVLAHEFAHLSHAHGKFGSWCYRIRMTWAQLLHVLEEQQHWSACIFRRFFHWYVPIFAAYTFVLMRRHELEADHLAAEIVGREAMAQTLVDLEVRDALLSNQFWPALWEEAKQRQEPPDDVYARLTANAMSVVPDDVSRKSLETALARQTDAGDTHPSLRERLQHLVGEAGARVVAAASFTDSAARNYLAGNHEALERELSDTWRSQVTQPWQQQYAAIAEAREGVASLAARPAESLSPQECFQLASWTEDLKGSDAALPMYEGIMASHPDMAAASYAVGRIRLQRGDESGLPLIERAMDQDEAAILPGCQLAIVFLEQLGRPEAADRYRERGNAQHQLLVAAHEERSTINPNDSYGPSDLDAEHRTSLLAQLDRHPEVRRAFLVRKAVKHFADDAPMHVLLVQLGWPRFTNKSLKAQREAIDRISQGIEPPPGVQVFVVTDAHRELVSAIKSVPRGLLYDPRQRKQERRRAQSAGAQAERAG